MPDKRIELQIATNYDGKGAQQAKVDTDGMSSAARELKNTVEQLDPGLKILGITTMEQARQFYAEVDAAKAASEAMRMAKGTSFDLAAQQKATAATTLVTQKNTEHLARSMSGMVMVTNQAQGMFMLLGGSGGALDQTMSRLTGMTNAAAGVSSQLGHMKQGGMGLNSSLGDMWQAADTTTAKMGLLATAIGILATALIAGFKFGSWLSDISGLTDECRNAERGFLSLAESLAALDAPAQEAQETFWQTINPMKVIADILDIESRLWTGYAGAQDQATESLKRLDVELEQHGQKIHWLQQMGPPIPDAQSILKSEESMKKLQKQVDMLTEAHRRGMTVQQYMIATGLGYANSLEWQIAKLKEEDKAFKAVTLSQKELDKICGEFIPTIEGMGTALEEVTDEWQDFGTESLKELLALEATKPKLDEVAIAIQNTAAAAQDLGVKLELTTAEWQQFGDAAYEASMAATAGIQDLWSAFGRDILSGDFTDIVDNMAEYFRGAWADAIGGIIEEWRKAQADMAKWKAEGSQGEAPAGFQMSGQQWGMVGTAAFSTLGQYATQNNQKGQQIMAMGTTIAGLTAMIPVIGWVISAIVMALTAIVAAVQDNGKRAIRLMMTEAGTFVLESTAEYEQFDDVMKDMYKKVQDAFRKYYIGFRDVLNEMGVDTSNIYQDLIRAIMNSADTVGRNAWAKMAGWRKAIDKTILARLASPLGGMGGDEKPAGGAGGLGGVPGAPDASDVAGAQDINMAVLFDKPAVGDAMKRFNDWLENGLGLLVFKALDGMFREGFTNLGVTGDMQDAMMKYWSESLNADDLFESLMRYIKNLMGLQKEMANLQQSGADLFQGVKDQMNMSFADQLAQYDEGLAKLADNVRNALDFEDMNTQGAELLTRLQERYQMEIQYLQQLAQMQKQLNESADQQMRSLSRIGKTPEKIIGLDMQEYQSLLAELMGATTAEEAGSIFQEIQALINEIVGAAGDNAGSYKDILMEMLSTAKDAMNEKMDALAQAVADQNAALYEKIGDVLDYFTGEAFDSGDAMNELAGAARNASDALNGIGGNPYSGEPRDRYTPGGDREAAPRDRMEAPPFEVHVHIAAKTEIETDACGLIKHTIKQAFEELDRYSGHIGNKRS